MTVIYQAQNAIEAHMLVGLLHQHGCVSARVEGDGLQGAVGELPTMDLVRIQVNDNEVDHARDIIQAWEQQQPATPEEPSSSSSDWINGVMLGFIVGVVVTLLFVSQ
ncbi:hypothetical protein GCM10011297_04960 [Bacterioplanes sanyensis]|uniref:putative signal transducing protein n=1 Tax=Bacterioplanes sanyensis TaxID=1249553 RepID=UPI0016725614|nr:DUF2007 domain-containing protein [Bacterioplanes sanyensis]GGY34895.1 hypothetical protein GCM10011297_04960 [Bacterioplanes sanyensis]